MLTVATLLWDANQSSHGFSRIYDETWVTRLRSGFSRHLTQPFRFVLFTDRRRDLPRDIMQVLISTDRPDYGNCIEPYRLNAPMILTGLDTVVVGNVDHLADYCMTSKIMALPQDPYDGSRACNGVALVPTGHHFVFDGWNGENDMDWVRKQPHKLIDLLFRGHVVSYKGHVRGNGGLGDARIVYFHGDQKPHQLKDQPWIRKHWLGE